MTQRIKRPVIFQLSRIISRQEFLPTGVDRVELRYAYWLLQEKHKGRTVVFVRQKDNILSKLNDRTAERLILKVWTKWVENKPVKRSLWQRRFAYPFFKIYAHLKKLFKHYIDPAILTALQNQSAPAYINSSPVGAEFPIVHQLLKQKIGAQLYFYIHDLMPIHYPDFFPIAAPKFPKRIELIAKQSHTVLVNSVDTLQQMRSYCLQNNLRIPKMIQIKLGVEDQFQREESKSELPVFMKQQLGDSPFFITVGMIQPRKNYTLLLKVWCDIVANWESQTHPCPKLLIIGQRGWSNEETLNLLEQSPLLRDKVFAFSEVDDKLLIQLILHAKALLMPSFAEGWGLPVTEALTLGTAVICSDLPALRESGQNQAFYLNPLDEIAWKNRIIDYTLSLKKPTINYVPERWKNHFEHLSTLLDQ